MILTRSSLMDTTHGLRIRSPKPRISCTPTISLQNSRTRASQRFLYIQAVSFAMEKYASSGRSATNFIHNLDIPDTKLQNHIDSDLLNQGISLSLSVLGDKPMPSPSMNGVSLAQGSSTSLYAALAPELSGKHRIVIHCISPLIY